MHSAFFNSRKWKVLLSPHGLRKIRNFLKVNKSSGIVNAIFHGARSLFENSQRVSLNSIMIRIHEIEESASSFKPTASSEIIVVVPVFNGVDIVERCINSVLKSDPTLKILVVDDCSTDSSMFTLYSRYVRNYTDRFNWTSTERNLGFTGAANLGLRMIPSGTHCILLNSDTVVPLGFAKIMVEGILHDSKVASVTALTNAGEIASIPQLSRDTALPAIESVILINKDLVNSTRYRKPSSWPTIPTPVGFCMLVPSQVLKAVGYFDEEFFSPGYGEESEWGERAKKLGYRHLLCPLVYVHHAHGATYGPAKLDLIREHQEILLSRYPEFTSEVQSFFVNDPLKTWRIALFLRYAAMSETLQKNLVFDHLLGGGATNTLNQEIQNSNDLYICVFKWGKKISFKIQMKSEVEIIIDCEKIEFEDFIKNLNIQIITINTLTFVAESSTADILETIVNLTKHTSAQLYLNFHDYNSICPSYNLINSNGIFCDIPTINECLNCLEKNPHKWDPENLSIIDWRSAWARVVTCATQIRFYSIESAERFTSVYGASDKIYIKAHEVKNKLLNFKNEKPTPKNVLNIATIGNLNYAKGAKVLQDLRIHISKESKGHRLFHFGNFDVGRGMGSGITFLGPYSDLNELRDGLTKVKADLIVIPSIWPETFNLVAEEISEVDMPIIMKSIGAPYERYKENPNFFFTSNLDSAELLEFIENSFREFTKGKY